MSDDLDLFVIGGGSGGVRAARVAAAHGARVAIAEEHRYGGTCVIRGCIPKKLFVYASEFDHAFEDAHGYGWNVNASLNWRRLRERKDAEIDRLNRIYLELLKTRGVAVHHGRARLVDRHTVEIGGERYRSRIVLIATGGAPHLPQIPGVELAITSNEAFDLPELPAQITIVGAGYIGLEFAGIFRGLGCEVTIVHHRDRVLRGFDEDVRRAVTDNLRREGIQLLMNTEVTAIRRTDRGLEYDCLDGRCHEADQVMFSTGRRPNTAGMGLEAAGIALSPNGAVVVSDESQTNVDNIYAVGDCTDRIALTPVAIREGQAFADTLFGKKNAVLDHRCIPTAIFSQPPAAMVGLSETEARELGAVRIYRSEFRPLFHTLSGRDQKVMMKLVVDDASDRVLGVHMVGRDAAEIIQAVAIAVRMGATKADFDSTVALHPTTAEELVLMRTPVGE